MDAVIHNLLCPITHALPIKPVTAEDGYTYDLDAITRHLETKKTSPMTNNEMGVKLVPAQNISNTLHALLDSGVENDALKEWGESIEVKTTDKDGVVTVRQGDKVLYKAGMRDLNGELYV